MLSLFFFGGIFLRNTMKWADGKLRSLQKNQKVVLALDGVPIACNSYNVRL